MKLNGIVPVLLSAMVICACKKESKTPNPVVTAKSVSFNSITVNGINNGYRYVNVNKKPVIKIGFIGALNHSSVNDALKFTASDGTAVSFSTVFVNDSTLQLTPAGLSPIAKYSLNISTALKSSTGGVLVTPVSVQFVTAIDSTDKFARISDDLLLDTVEARTFQYFWDFGHPVSGMARERNTSGDVVTTGGTGFGVMALLVAVNRHFISRTDGVARMQKIVGFLKNTAQKFHGAFPHWMNGSTGVVVPFADKDDGADLVETSYLMEGLITARQYFDGSNSAETGMRNDITTLFDTIEWDFFTQGQNVLYWHWSPNYGFDLNVKIQGWNEALITYVMAASSPTHGISKAVYDNGWAGNGTIKNGASYEGVTLPLGPAFGGPLFFEHYTFMAVNPNGLTDTYATYELQAEAHANINYKYCVANPKGYAGYSADCWGLTASDINGGYTASSPTNDVGVIAPTAAISSLPYTPVQSMQALRFFYYKLGDKLWGKYGFYDAFSLDDPWFSGTYLAIDQMPQVVMIENWRTGLIWNAFITAAEVKAGMHTLGFKSPYLN